MKIFKVTTSEVADDPATCISSYRAPRTTKREEYFMSREKAQTTVDARYKAIIGLAGFIPKMEMTISEIEVIE